MTTKRALIEQAAGEFGLTGFDLSPEDLQEGLARLNRIAAQWDGKGIRVGFNIGGGVEDEAGIPDTAENAFALALAVQWGPSFGKAVSQDIRNGARAAWNDLYTSMGVKPQVPRPSNLPLGTGNRTAGVFGAKYFPDTDEIEGLNDGATEY